MSDVFVVDALRTPFGSFNGMLADVTAPQMATTVMQGLLTRTGLAADRVDEVIVGQVLSGGCGQAPARQAMRGAGIPDSAHALTINKVCGSGLKAIMLGADAIRLGDSQVVIAGGMESMSLAPYVMQKARTGYRMGHGQLLDLMIYDGLTDPYTGRHMGEIGEASVARFGLSREEQDEFAARSYQLAQAAVNGGLFVDEIVPVVKQSKKGEEVLATDEEPFKGDPAKLALLKPVFKKDGTITAGNASTINDGAALALLTDADGLKRHNLKAKARIVACATESRHPDNFPDAPIGAIEKVVAKAGLTMGDIDLFEINEAFASVVLLAIKALKLPLDKVNVNGGACAIGHPIGASGARLAATVIRELHKRQLRYGLATLCIGGGEAVAVIFERV
ncbi:MULTISPECIES: thiolase family protein [Geobacter]|uniref:Acetyl-CoA acetyltransferase n=2 Tax=Geobacter TaxID=28231 RepID=A0A0C1QYC0_9BACT|nr:MULTISPECIES: thiolase family protein [Geobacter]KIE43156.1 acetyl-CoA acetyltransferase [Geobacter soli]MBE2888174.1 thiolase family protein [Geobacter anodireducens]HMN03309.1 thiolase family protein [Geobacter anodireducens]